MQYMYVFMFACLPQWSYRSDLVKNRDEKGKIKDSKKIKDFSTNLQIVTTGVIYVRIYVCMLGLD